MNWFKRNKTKLPNWWATSLRRKKSPGANNSYKHANADQLLTMKIWSSKMSLYSKLFSTLPVLDGKSYLPLSHQVEWPRDYHASWLHSLILDLSLCLLVKLPLFSDALLDSKPLLLLLLSLLLVLHYQILLLVRLLPNNLHMPIPLLEMLLALIALTYSLVSDFHGSFLLNIKPREVLILKYHRVILLSLLLCIWVLPSVALSFLSLEDSSSEENSEDQKLQPISALSYSCPSGSSTCFSHLWKHTESLAIRSERGADMYRSHLH